MKLHCLEICFRKGKRQRIKGGVGLWKIQRCPIIKIQSYFNQMGHMCIFFLDYFRNLIWCFDVVLIPLNQNRYFFFLSYVGGKVDMVIPIGSWHVIYKPLDQMPLERKEKQYLLNVFLLFLFNCVFFVS